MTPEQTQVADPTRQDPAQQFPAIADRYRREIFAHCYRMTGSVHDAEDLVQETYLRAWKAYHGFENRSSVRTWLYRIATNTCLTALDGRNRRPLPVGLGGAQARPGDQLEADHEIPWLEPVPEALVDSSDPADLAVAKDSIRLAFVAALQHLPARQRAVLVLRDVLRWPAAEVADALGTSTAAVNSLLQRAHAQLDAVKPSLDDPAAAADTLTDAQQALLDRYVKAFWDKDMDTLVGMFTAEAVWEMPPHLSWYRGPADIAWLIGNKCPGGRHDMPMVATVANGQPAFGLYMRTPTGDYLPFHLQVLDLADDGKVRHVAAFFDTTLFAHFGLPARLPADSPLVPAVPAGAVGAT